MTMERNKPRAVCITWSRLRREQPSHGLPELLTRCQARPGCEFSFILWDHRLGHGALVTAALRDRGRGRRVSASCSLSLDVKKPYDQGSQKHLLSGTLVF